MFQANGFVDFVSVVYLRELCHRANLRFQALTRNRLSLELNSDNGFQVRDMVNGGETRSVKTLSGGQTFQAALSLALALADNLQARSQGRHNFFFLDEGFGSLDRESLQVVFDTLKALRREDRIVGVISHVEDLQQEIDVHLRIHTDDERGSWIVPHG
jgi:exonuclease SbcC